MLTIDERSKEVIDSFKYQRGVVAIYKIDGMYYIEYGWFKPDKDSVPFVDYYNGQVSDCINKNISEDIIFSKKDGYYILKPQRLVDKLENELIKGNGNYPYRISREYEADKNLDNFKDAQTILKEENFELSKYLKYTFGVEFETSEGYVPQDLCFRDGLIPLRDGSITGVEYSTVVLSGNSGLNLLKQQCNTLKEYTNFNKNCALHIHLGGYPISAKYIFTLYRILFYIQSDIECIIPPYSFHTGQYKDNGKEYCAPLPFFETFNDFYYYMSDNNTPFVGDLYQSHPNDVEHERKWNIRSRYHNFNFVNMLFYNKAKTLELRFFRPSFNFNKIYLWLAIFNGILLFAEKESASLTLDKLEADTKRYRKIGLIRIFESVYPDDFVNYLIDGMVKLKCVVRNQINNGDHIGHFTEFEDAVF